MSLASSRTLISQTSLEMVGQEITLSGFVDTKRDHGKITFIDLRDRSGIIQCVGYKMMGEVTTESVITVTGILKARSERNINPDLPTGEIELDVQSYQVLSQAAELPLTLTTDGLEIGEETRLKYRYLDLRRSRLQHNLRTRSAFVRALRDAFYAEDFVEIETPILSQATKEGARDFLVPSRFQPGSFYALPQSPQQYKQLLMTAGFERYFQMARCFRDEDLRADRLFELTQVDVELSYVYEPQDIMEVIEKVVKQALETIGATDRLKDTTFPVIDYAEAVGKYGADRFDLRTPTEQAEGKLAFAWVVNFPFFKKVDQADAAEVADGKSGWTFTHNPFSKPLTQYEADHLAGKNIGEIITAQYDLVCNGYEVGGGSLRAHTPELLKATFRIMGYSDEEIETNVGHLLEALSLGTPPHGGIALGLDRLMMVLCGETSCKETVAFPTSKSGRTAVMSAPAPATANQLKELHLQIIPPAKNENK